MSSETIAALIEVDARLLVAGERLARERKSGTANAYIVQAGVCDRLLDRRLELMAQRNRYVEASARGLQPTGGTASLPAADN